MDDIRDEFIARVVDGRRFLEVGGLWGEVMEKVSVAARAGASSLTMVDILPQSDPLWARFAERASQSSLSVACVTANLDAATTVPLLAGQFDVVHCSGILYHCPNPLHTLSQLFQITEEYVILTSTSVPEHFDTSVGAMTLGRGGIRLVPYMDDVDRRTASARWNDLGITGLLGLDTEWEWDVNDYSPWWWLFTPSALHQMASAVGFEVLDEGPFWDGLAHTLLLKKRWERA